MTLGKLCMHNRGNGYLTTVGFHMNSKSMFRYVPVASSCRNVSISAHVFARFQTVECELMSPVRSTAPLILN